MAELSIAALWPQLAVMAVAFLTVMVVTPLVARFAVRYRFVDRPNPRRTGPLKPRLGGIALLLGVIAGIAVALLVVPERTDEELWRILGLLLAGVVAAGLGAVDDRFELSSTVQLLGQLVVALIAISFGILIESFNNPIAALLGPAAIVLPTTLAVGVTLFWLLGAMNTVNFIDGLDGLAAAIVGVAALILFMHTFALGQTTVAMLPATLIGALAAFLLFNAPPARITMGTTGSLFLGVMIASMSVVGGTKAASLLLVLIIPILDTAWLIVSRISRGRAPFHGDRAHLHHRLLDLGWSQRQIVLVLSALTLASGSLALWVPTPLYKLYALAAVGVLVLAALVVLARRQDRPQGTAGRGGGGAPEATGVS